MLAPVLALVDPSLVPVAVLLPTAVLPILSLLRERAAVDWRGLRWALVGRLPGTLVGAWVATALPLRLLAVAVGVVVLGAVVVSLVRWEPRATPRALLAAGFVSGVTGTATSIGGPPIALVYQRASGPAIRSTLAAFFLVGVVVSLSALALTGAVDRRDLGVAAVLLPFTALGFAVSGPLRPYVDAAGTRPAVLTLCAASALVLILRNAL